MTVEGEPGAEPAGRAFVIARVFDAPREAVWKAWTEAERLECWWGPDGFAAKRCAMDLRPGGSFHYGLRMPGGGVVWGRWAIREVAAPERLDFVASFSDEQGGGARNPWAADRPLETLSTVPFADRNGGGTEVAVAATADAATEAERAAFAAGFGSMRQGWTGTFDQLGYVLARDLSLDSDANTGKELP